jgi:Lipid A 3-O-deacylase (PagL)
VYAGKRSVVLSLAPLLCALSAFPQAGVSSVDRANQLGEGTMRLVREKQILAVPSFNISECFADRAGTSAQGARERQVFGLDAQESPGILGNKTEEDAQNQPSEERLRGAKPADLNRDIYYKNKLEFSLEGGWLPINIPFPLDVFVGDVYNTYPLKYTLVPIIASLRWHMNDIGGPWILRGNWDLTSSASVTAIPRGPETRYFAYIMGIRRNFVSRNSRIAPYFDIRLGLGNIDAKGPAGVQYAQGQDFTFTVNMGSGVRYNFNPRYAISAGMNFMHISNLDLSESNGKPNWGVRNYGINVYGPFVGIDLQLRRHPRDSER